MKKKIYEAILVSACAGILSTMAPGCRNLGNGKVDIPEFELGLTDASGQEYAIANDADGLHIQGKYYSPRTGLTYVVTEDGGFEVRDPLGNTLRLKLDPEND